MAPSEETTGEASHIERIIERIDEEPVDGLVDSAEMLTDEVIHNTNINRSRKVVSASSVYVSFILAGIHITQQQVADAGSCTKWSIGKAHMEIVEEIPFMDEEVQDATSRLKSDDD